MKRTRQQVRNQLRAFIEQTQRDLLSKAIPPWCPHENDLDTIIDLVRYPPAPLGNGKVLVISRVSDVDREQPDA